MKLKSILSVLSIAAIFISCGGNKNESDATGTFEAEETIVSSELPGKLVSFNVSEGMQLIKDSVIGMVDATNINLQEQQVEASIDALNQKTADASPQVRLLQNQLAVQQSQLDNLLHERTRIEN